MKPSVPLAALGLVLLALTTAGCGGSEEPTASLRSFPFLSPERATVAPGGTAEFEAGIVEGTYTSLEVSVREGDAGGSVASRTTSPNVVYTAPATPGTYHVRVRFRNGDEEIGSRTATITVAASR